MPWRNFFSRKPHTEPGAQPQPTPAQPPPTRVIGRAAIGHGAASDPATLERRRARIARRVEDLRYDLALAESATHEPNRWTERADELRLAIEQARRDEAAVRAAPAGRVGVPLPPTPVTVERVAPAEPAEVIFSIGGERFRYGEVLDWAERGHQKAPPQLRRAAGDVTALLPDATPLDQRDELREHLAHGLATLAARLRDDALDGVPARAWTLADLASPCPECGGWRDLFGRCPACQARAWEAGRLRADADRLAQERHGQLEEARRWAERLPILRRQLADAEAELARMSADAPPW